jgi:hypothetical protein
MPIPSFVMMALVAAGTLNSSAANLSTAVKGVFSGTLSLSERNDSEKSRENDEKPFLHFVRQLRIRRQRYLKGYLGPGTNMPTSYQL